MTAAESSLIGIAKQTAKGSPNTTDAEFKYMYFTQGSVSPNSMVIPLDPEVGGGALLRDMKKVGVMSGGAMEFIPRPESLGFFLYGATGAVTSGDAQMEEAVMKRTALTSATQNIAVGLSATRLPSKVCIRGYKVGSTLTGNVTINGTVSGSPDTEVIALNGNALVKGTKIFTAIASIDLPVQVTAGDMVSVGVFNALSKSHIFKLGADQFDAPYFTVRSAPGSMWGEQFQDIRINALALEFRGANFVRGTVGMSGGLPKKVATTTWSAPTYMDKGSPFISPVSSIELPSGTNMSVMSGSFTAGMAIPMDEQWVVGSYAPEGFDIVNRGFAVSLNVKITDGTLYSKMQYDPAGGSDWAVDMLRDANFAVRLLSDMESVSGLPFSLTINANSMSGQNANVVWAASPIGLRAGRQVVMQINGVFIADPLTSNVPIEMNLINDRASY